MFATWGQKLIKKKRDEMDAEENKKTTIHPKKNLLKTDESAGTIFLQES